MKTLDRILFKLLLFFVRSPAKEACAEFFGTLFLVVCGDGVMATVTLGRLGPHGVIVSAIGWGLAIAIAVAIAGSVSGGHVNPAVTLALASVKKCPWKYVAHYMAAQYLGGFMAAAFVYIVYYGKYKFLFIFGRLHFYYMKRLTARQSQTTLPCNRPSMSIPA
ncbi:hypothetical protein AVEN_35952-1 [Araneus ventricosus]|uniref:Aquaporin-9 n=1 Tax=Araneus ventricosus TaxID=182803 RepID=A0A4Y2H1H7_ARAVE|nr:hypothetical protein AVEN_35952-1 [Araneus ventricosus]